MVDLGPQSTLCVGEAGEIQQSGLSSWWWVELNTEYLVVLVRYSESDSVASSLSFPAQRSDRPSDPDVTFLVGWLALELELRFWCVSEVCYHSLLVNEGACWEGSCSMRVCRPLWFRPSSSLVLPASSGRPSSSTCPSSLVYPSPLILQDARPL